jgi:alcohol dehydrogenase class IV
MAQTFAFRCPQQIAFGPGTLRTLGTAVRGFGSHALLVTGSASLRSSGRLDECIKLLDEAGATCTHVTVHGEPSPEGIDDAVRTHGTGRIDVVVAVGGGSAIDFGKAVAAMLPVGGSVSDYLEGVGTKRHPGTTLPLVAVPTTAGTGSEATKNAVLSRVGASGFKKSLRHDNFVPSAAIVDPTLHLSCPPNVTAACGMDAFTQLLESFVSNKATPLTDSLALSGLHRLTPALVPAATDRAGDIDARADMAYGALLSGITLANAGLGVVHGLASTIGGMAAVPHGVVCAALLAPATAATIAKLRSTGDSAAAGFLAKYAAVGRLTGRRADTPDPNACDALVASLEEWAERLGIPWLGDFGLGENDIAAVAEATGCKNNPVELTTDEIGEIVTRALRRRD